MSDYTNKNYPSISIILKYVLLISDQVFKVLVDAHFLKKLLKIE